MKTYSLFLIFLFCRVSVVLGQELPQIVPPSPNAASLAQYADVPVSHYTGVPNISIPLLDVNSGKIQLPISLSYHSSGIQVMQEASNVGLGWALNAGGVITRQLRGIDDFDETYGYIKTILPPATEDNLPDWSGDNFDEYYPTYVNIKAGNYDSGPDIFYYNFLGYSGKLVFEKQLESGNIVMATPVDQNNLSFSYNIYLKTWTITDGNGWKYYLGSVNLNAVETTENHGSSSTDAPLNPTNYRLLNDDPDTSNSAWYLTKIVTPEGDEIEFLYEMGSKILSQIGRGEELHDLLEIKYKNYGFYNFHTTEPLLSARYTLYTTSQQVTEPVYLKKINFKNGFVEFIYDDREDLRLYDSSDPQPQSLKSVKLFSSLPEKLIKQVDFSYSYFNATVSSGSNLYNPERKKRLRLDAVQESVVNEQNQILTTPPYIFSYNDTSLPEKTSYSIDGWGYYNGNNNNSVPYYNVGNQYGDYFPIILAEPQSYETYKMLSPFYEGKGIGADNLFLRGANRNVNEAKAKASILESIQYPTGAIDYFEHESNDYYDESNTLYDDGPLSVSAIVNHQIWSSDEESITLDKLTFVNLWFKIINLSSIDINENMIAVLEDSNGNVLVSMAPGENFLQRIDFQTNVSLFLPAGTYKLRVANNTAEDGIVIEAKAEYIKKNVTTKKKGGGLRIKSITTKDQGSFVKKKEYSYEDNTISTGRLVSPFRFYYNEILSASNPVEIYTGQYLVRTSDSAIPYGNSAQGNVVGYDRVKVSSVDADDNKLGISEYFYRNEEEKPVEMAMPGVPTLVNLSNGQLLKENYFNQNGDTIREKTIDYLREDFTTKKLKGVKINSFFLTNSAAEIRFYDMYSEWWHPESSTETVYDINGNNPITTTTYYNYENPLHKNLTKTTTTDSKGKALITINKYPHDLPSGIDQTTSTVISSMITDHVINPVIKSETTVGGNVISGSINNYSIETHTDENNVSNNMYLPLNVKTLKRGTTSAFENRLEFTEYDGNGHILQVKKPDGTPVSYVWGYNNEYPIAKIENATYSQVSGQVANLQGLSNSDDDRCLDSVTVPCDEKNLRTALAALRASFPEAMVTTYTYDPLIGVTSMTDPKGYTVYYEYDGFNRLEQVIDAEGYILSENEYNYKQ